MQYNASLNRKNPLVYDIKVTLTTPVTPWENIEYEQRGRNLDPRRQYDFPTLEFED